MKATSQEKNENGVSTRMKCFFSMHNLEKTLSQKISKLLKQQEEVLKKIDEVLSKL